jgi:pimeloyl-ACP methyl ester carboxylesterase
MTRAPCPTFIEAGEGDAVPLVMLHGIGSTAAGWRRHISAFGVGRRALAWNAPGYADSAPLTEARPHVDDYAQRLLVLLDETRIESAVLMASSWGSLIALAAAAAWPDRIRKLILSGPTAGYGGLSAGKRQQLMDARSTRAQAIGIAAMLEADTPRLVAPEAAQSVLDDLAHAQRGVHLDGYLQALHAMVNEDALRTATCVRCPTLVIAGARDLVAPAQQHASLIHHALHASRFHVLEDCGHLPHAERAEDFAGWVRAFL